VCERAGCRLRALSGPVVSPPGAVSPSGVAAEGVPEYSSYVNHQVVNELPSGSPCAGRRVGCVSQVFELVESLSRKLQHLRRRTVSRTGLTPPQYVVLGALAERDRRPLKDLAEIAGCSRAAVTGIVDALECKDLVVREPNPDDRRSILLALTPEGRALHASTPGLHALFEDCCSGLSPDEVSRLAELLARLDRSLGSWAPES
jgi:DNA-binding MarR family transcriptional regulator